MKYYTKNDTEQFAFIKTPRFLFQDSKYITLSAMAKLMYGLILDRLSVSRKNNWIDRDGCVYIIYTVEETAKVLNCSEDTATKVLKELSDEGAGLITRKRRGQGKPSLIYVYNIPDENNVKSTATSNVESNVENRGKLFVPISETDNTDVKSEENQDSRVIKSRVQETEQSGCNQNNSNQTKYNQTNMNHISSALTTDNRTVESVENHTDEMMTINNKINYDLLCSEYGDSKAARVSNLIADVINGKRTVKVDGKIIDKDEAVSVFNKIDHKTVVNVLETMSRITVYSPASWIPTALYNAVTCGTSTYKTYQTTPKKKPGFMSEPSFDLDLIMEHARNVPLGCRNSVTQG